MNYSLAHINCPSTFKCTNVICIDHEIWQTVHILTIAVTVTKPKPKTAVFVRTMENRNRGLFGAKWRRFCRPTFVFI